MDPRNTNNTHNNDPLLNVDEINELMRLIIQSAFSPGQNTMLSVDYHGMDLSQLSAVNLAMVRLRFKITVAEIVNIVVCNYELTDVTVITRNLFARYDDLETALVLFTRKFHRIYFALLYKIPYNTRRKPQGHPSEPAKVQLYKIDPTFVEFDKNFLTSLFVDLDAFLSDAFERIPYRDQLHQDRFSTEFKELVMVMHGLADASVKVASIDDETGSSKAFDNCITTPVTELLNFANAALALELENKFITCASIETDRMRRKNITDEIMAFNNNENRPIVPIDYLISDIKPDILLNGNNRKSIMFCEIKGPSFEKYKNLYLNFDRLPLDMDDNFKDLSLEGAYYLICTGTDICIMSDFNCLVLLSLNYDDDDRKIEVSNQRKDSNELSNKSKVDYERFRKDQEDPPQNNREAHITFKSLFIDTETPGMTIQGAFASLLFHQLTLNQDQLIQQSRNCSKLCRTLTRSGFHLLELYEDRLREFKTMISSVYQSDDSIKDIKLDLNYVEDLEIIHVNDNSKAQILKFKNNKYNSKFTSALGTEDKIIAIKMYDNMSLNKLYDLNCKEDSLEEFKTYTIKHWVDEVDRYQTITNYRTRYPNKILDVPEFFSHGILEITDGDTFICGGLFIAMSYIEPMEYPSDSPKIDSRVMKRCKKLVKQLAKIKVKYNYIESEELIYHDEKLFITDFSNKFDSYYDRKNSNFDDLKMALKDLKQSSANKFKYQSNEGSQLIDHAGQKSNLNEPVEMVNVPSEFGTGLKEVSGNENRTRKRGYNGIELYREGERRHSE